VPMYMCITEKSDALSLSRSHGPCLLLSLSLYLLAFPQIKKEKQEEEMKQLDEAKIPRHQWSPNSEVLGFSGKELCRAPNPEVSHTSLLALSCSRSCLRTRTVSRALCVSLPEPLKPGSQEPQSGHCTTISSSLSPCQPLTLSLLHAHTVRLYMQAPTAGKSGRVLSATEQMHRSVEVITSKI
jgi:hypothetical protein